MNWGKGLVLKELGLNPMDFFDNEENRCSENAKLLLKLLEGQK